MSDAVLRAPAQACMDPGGSCLAVCLCARCTRASGPALTNMLTAVEHPVRRSSRRHIYNKRAKEANGHRPLARSLTASLERGGYTARTYTARSLGVLGIRRAGPGRVGLVTGPRSTRCVLVLTVSLDSL
jgi:hypothetical protein